MIEMGLRKTLKEVLLDPILIKGYATIGFFGLFALFVKFALEINVLFIIPALLCFLISVGTILD